MDGIASEYKMCIEEAICDAKLTIDGKEGYVLCYSVLLNLQLFHLILFITVVYLII